MIQRDQVPDFLRLMMMIPALQELSDQRAFDKLLEITERQRMELLELAKIDSETYEQAIDKVEREKLWKNLKAKSLRLDSRITDKMQTMSIANLESCTRYVGQNQIECFDLFESYLEKTGARKDQIAAFQDMAKILRFSFARLLHYQHCSLRTMQADQGELPYREKRRAQEANHHSSKEEKRQSQILGGEKYGVGNDRRTDFLSRR